MDKTNIILEDGSLKEVDSIFYLYNSKYYFIYTLKEIDENGYVILYIVQVGKEVKQTPTGQVETGYMIGVDIKDPVESQSVQTSITKIVDSKKNGTQIPDIKFLPMSMLVNLKIGSKKTFRLLQNIVKYYFGLKFDDEEASEDTLKKTVVNENTDTNSNVGVDVDSGAIIDFRSKYYEEEDKNKELEKEIKYLNEKLNEIRKVMDTLNEGKQE